MSVKVPLLTWLRQIWNMLEKCLNNTLCCTRSLEFAETVCCQLVTVSQTLPLTSEKYLQSHTACRKKNSTSTHAQRVVLVGLLIQWISVLWSSTAGQLLEVPIWINPVPQLSDLSSKQLTQQQRLHILSINLWWKMMLWYQNILILLHLFCLSLLWTVMLFLEWNTPVTYSSDPLVCDPLVCTAFRNSCWS